MENDAPGAGRGGSTRDFCAPSSAVGALFRAGFAVVWGTVYIRHSVSNLFKTTFSTSSTSSISWALVIALALVHVFPVAADLLVCLDDRPDRGCCESTSASDARTGAAARLLDGADCSCCVTVQVVSHKPDAIVQEDDPDRLVESGVVAGHVASIVQRGAPASRGEPGNARLPSLRTVVLLI